MHRTCIFSTLCLSSSGAVVVSSIHYGFFLVTPDWDAIDADLESRVQFAEQSSFRDVVSATDFTDFTSCPSLCQTKQCEVEDIVC